MVVYLLFSYKRTTVLWVNAFVFLIIALRCSFEYFIQTQDDYSAIHPFNVANGFSYLASGLLSMCTWWYIRPLKGNRFEKIVNKIYIGIISFWMIISVYPVYNRLMFYMPPEKIEGYWKYTTLQNDWTYFYFSGHMFLIIVSSIMFFLDYIRGNWWDFRKIIFITFITYFPLVGNLSVLWNSGETNFLTPNLGFFYTASTIICSWFFSGYRIFSEQVNEIVQDTFDSISDLVFFVDKDYRILQVNQSTTKLFGAGVMGKRLDGFLNKGDIEKGIDIDEMLKSLMDEREKEGNLSLFINNKMRAFKVKVSEMKKGNRISGFTFVMNDITDLKSIQEELSEQNYIKDRIFAVLGHDLRKPVISFQGIAKKVNFLLKKQDYKRLLELGENIEENALSLTKLTDNLLKWALAQRNVVPYEPMDVVLHEAVEEVALSLRMLMDEKSIKIENQITFTPRVFVDINALYTILRNLLDNAIKYCGKHGNITFHSEEREDCIVIAISDDGIGIAPEKIDQIFDLKRGKSELGTAGEKGTGLGLHLVKELVKLNKGAVFVESELGLGTTFYIELPKQ